MNSSANTTLFLSTEYKNDGMEHHVDQLILCGYLRDHVGMFLIYGIGVSIMSVIGIFGNILCFIVLSRPYMRTSTNILLLGLSAFDFVFVFISLLIRGIPWSIMYFCVESFESFYFTTLFPFTGAYFAPLIYIGLLGSTYFTLLVSMERCFVVYRPLMARPYCTNKNAIRASLGTVLFITLVTLPSWWDYRLESVYDESGSWTNYSVIDLLLANQNYKLYCYTWFGMFVYRIIPIPLLILLNTSIYWKVRAAKKTRESMTQLVNSSDTSLAKMLMWVVSIFLLSNLSHLVAYVREIVGLEENAELGAVSAFLFTLNSTVNFLIYCVMTKKFRRVALELCWPKKWSGGPSDNVPMNPK